jgi:MFS family permease
MPRIAALRHRDFAIFWSAHLASRIGTQMRDVALSWHIWVLTKSPLALGMLGAARVVPILLLSLGGGVAADAFDRRRVMLVTQSILALTSAAMAATTLSGRVSAPLLYALLAFAAAAAAFDSPARQSLVVNLLPARDLEGGLTLMIFGFQLATVVGPAIGGALIAVTSVQAIYAIDAVSFLAVLCALYVVRPLSAEGADVGAPKADVSVRAAFEALRFLRSRPVLVWLMVIDFLGTFFAGATQLMPIFASEIFHVGARGLGVLVAAPAVGAVVATVALSARGPMKRHGVAVVGAVVVYGACITAFGLTRSFALALVLLAGSGAADTVSTVVRQLARQLLTPDALRGRMTAVNMVFFIGGPQLGEAEAGALASLTSARVSVVSGGVACMLVALAVAALAPALRRLRLSSANDGIAGDRVAAGASRPPPSA